MSFPLNVVDDFLMSSHTHSIRWKVAISSCSFHPSVFRLRIDIAHILHFFALFATNCFDGTSSDLAWRALPIRIRITNNILAGSSIVLTNQFTIIPYASIYVANVALQKRHHTTSTDWVQKRKKNYGHGNVTPAHLQSRAYIKFTDSSE